MASKAALIDKVRESASALIPQILATKDEKLAEFVKVHQADCDSYTFECRRHGDFLAVFIQRGPMPLGVISWKPDNKIAATIVLGETQGFYLRSGEPPSMNGDTTFHQVQIVNGGDEVLAQYKNAHYPRYEMLYLPPPPGQRDTGQGMMGYYNDGALSGIRVSDCPCGATDDTIVFNNGVRISAPAGLGQGVYDKILASAERQ